MFESHYKSCYQPKIHQAAGWGLSLFVEQEEEIGMLSGQWPHLQGQMWRAETSFTDHNFFLGTIIGISKFPISII